MDIQKGIGNPLRSLRTATLHHHREQLSLRQPGRSQSVPPYRDQGRIERGDVPELQHAHYAVAGLDRPPIPVFLLDLEWVAVHHHNAAGKRGKWLIHSKAHLGPLLRLL
jgi:hypothetical protein